MKRHSAFVSFSHQDAASAQEVEQTLEAGGAAPSRARQDVRASADWPGVVGRTIADSDLLVLLWTEDAARSSFVEFEWCAALAMGKAIVVCRRDDTPLPSLLSQAQALTLDQLPSSLSGILTGLASAPPGQDAGPIIDQLRESELPDSQAAAEAAITLLRGVIAAGGAVSAEQPTVISQPPSGADAQTVISSPSTPERQPNTVRLQSTLADLDLGERYEVVRQLGEGGMGMVYQVHDKELDRDVALKLVKAEMAEDPRIIDRFKREIQLSSVVTHSNVLRVYDLGGGEGIRFLTMQLVEGEDLTEPMKRGPLGIDRALKIFRQICEGLKAAHDQGIVHRDLKPANVMLDENEHVYLTDFGLARADDPGPALTQVGEVMGTPHYMSPEQVKGEELDLRSDIYSLGVMLYEMVTGQLPYTGKTMYEVMIKRTQKAPEPANKLNPEIPKYVEQLIERSMERDRNKRYANLDELLMDLYQGMQPGDSLSFASGVYRAPVKPWKKFAIGIPLILVLAAGAYWIVQRPPPQLPQAVVQREPTSVLIADFDNNTGDSIFDGTLEQALAIGLESASFLESFRRERARSIATGIQPDMQSLDRDAARLVAQREGIGVVITGSIDAEGSSYTIAIEALDPFSGDSLATRQAKARSKEQVLAAVGELAIETRKALGDVASEAELQASLETITSSSLEASEAYARGQALQQQGKWQDAIAQYRAAIGLDPDMGRAYSGLAVMNFNLGRQEEAEEYFLKAMSKLDRMTPREKYKTRGNYYIFSRNYEKAVEEYTALVTEVPGDSNGRANLAYAAFFARDFDGAYEQAQRIAEADPGHVVKRANLAWYAMIANDFDRAVNEAQATLELDDSFQQTYLYLALTQVAQGDAEAAKQTWGRLEQLDNDGASLASLGLADLAAYRGAYGEAIALLRTDLQNEQAAQPEIKQTLLAQALLATGQSRDAVAAANAALATSQRLAVVFEAGLVFLQTGNRQRALELADGLTDSLQAEDRAYGKLLQGEAELMDGNLQEALTLFSDAQQLADTWLGRLALGRAYFEAEAYTEAYSEFERCIARRGEATSLFLDEVPTYRYFPQLYYWMGRSQEALQSPAAADSFQTFVDIRGEGDADPRVDEARSKSASG